MDSLLAVKVTHIPNLAHEIWKTTQLEPCRHVGYVDVDRGRGTDEQVPPAAASLGQSTIELVPR